MKYNLSEINEIIRNRRSVKPENFSKRKVQKEQILVMLENARWAPTHALTQPWRFVVFMENGLHNLSDFQSDKYKKNTAPDKFILSKFEQLKNRPLLASAVIAICMKRQEIEKLPEIEEIEAVACAVQNIHLTATAYGLVGYWTTGGITYTDEMKKFLQLESKDRCLGFFYIGYPDIPWPNGQRKPIEYFTRWEIT
jgi:nitroreductase